jgi:hypothetical protein
LSCSRSATTLPIVAGGVLMGMLSRRDVRCGVARRELTSANLDLHMHGSQAHAVISTCPATTPVRGPARCS